MSLFEGTNQHGIGSERQRVNKSAAAVRQQIAAVMVECSRSNDIGLLDGADGNRRRTANELDGDLLQRGTGCVDDGARSDAQALAARVND